MLYWTSGIKSKGLSIIDKQTGTCYAGLNEME